MIEKTGNIWHQACDAIVITTNGAVRKDGAAVMGRGCALEAKNKFYEIAQWLGENIQNYGNRLFAFDAENLEGYIPYLRTYEALEWVIPENHDRFNWLVTFPVKHHWKDTADLDLIELSTRQLRCVAGALCWKKIVMPRPGCGNGNRDWETEVKPILEEYLDDRFEVFTYAPTT